MDSQAIKESAMTGLITVVIGAIGTYILSLIWPTPWGLNDALIVVGLASLLAGFGGAYSVHMTYRK